jgi:hypothetical protein
MTMKTKLLILTAGLLLAGTSYALPYDVTSDPDATMNQEQKLGPNVRSHRFWNEIYTRKYGGYYRYSRYARYRYR